MDLPHLGSEVVEDQPPVPEHRQSGTSCLGGTGVNPWPARASVTVVSSSVAMRPLHRYRDYMVEVGVRELKGSLSKYLRRVRAGETVVITDRGRPIARIIPSSVPEDLARLMAEGRVTWSGGPYIPPEPVPIEPGPPLSDYISEDRR